MSKIYLSKISFKKSFSNFEKKTLRGKLHGFVMGFFPVATTNNPREEFNVLWSLETDRRGLDYLLVQSSVPFEKLSGPSISNKKYAVQTSEMNFLDKVDNNSEISYRVHVNPVKSHENKRTAIKDHNEIMEWWIKKIAQLGITPIDQAILDVNVSNISMKSSNFALADAVIVGRAKVVDVDSLRKSALVGVGKSKSYGCGLLLIGK